MAYYKKDPERLQKFSRWLRGIAPLKGFDSQRQLAIKAGINEATVSRIWNATQLPDEITLVKIAQALGVEVAEALTQAGYPVELVPERPATRADFEGEIIGDTGGIVFPTAPISMDSIGEVWKVPEQHYLPIIGVVRAGSGGIAFEEPLGYATVDKDAVPNGSRYFYLRVKGESMSPEIMPGDLALVREQPEVEYGELAVVIVDGEEGTIKRVFHKNGEVFLQATNPSYNRTEKADNVKIVGKVKKTVRDYK